MKARIREDVEIDNPAYRIERQANYFSGPRRKMCYEPRTLTLVAGTIVEGPVADACVRNGVADEVGFDEPDQDLFVDDHQVVDDQ